MQVRTVSERHQKLNGILIALSEFYGTPLRKALKLLHKKGMTLDEIRDQVFDNTLTRQAIHQNYMKEGKK